MRPSNLQQKSRRKHRAHWYRIYVGWCPICLRDKGHRERVYGPRPKDRSKRVVMLSDRETYDWCEL